MIYSDEEFRRDNPLGPTAAKADLLDCLSTAMSRLTTPTRGRKFNDSRYRTRPSPSLRSLLAARGPRHHHPRPRPHHDRHRLARQRQTGAVSPPKKRSPPTSPGTPSPSSKRITPTVVLSQNRPAPTTPTTKTESGNPTMWRSPTPYPPSRRVYCLPNFGTKIPATERTYAIGAGAPFPVPIANCADAHYFWTALIKIPDDSSPSAILYILVMRRGNREATF